MSFFDTLPSLFALWPFTYAAMLWWAAAAAIPIAIHLLSRRRYRETDWAAMQFLLAAVKKHARRLRIEQLILLALRVSVLILLALALADPTFYRRGGASASIRGGQTHWVLVIDGSYSMDYRQGQQSLFAQAQEAARQLVSDAEQGDGFTLILMSEPPVIAIREPAFDLEDVLREIDSLRVRHAGADLTASLREAAGIIDAAAKRQPRLKETRVCIYSDLGRRTWEATEADGCRKLLGEIAQVARLHIFEMGENRWQNAAVIRLDAQQAPAIVDRDVQFTAEVRRFSSDAPQQARAEWLVDQQVVREEQLDLTSGGDVLALNHRFAIAGEHEIELRIDNSDPLGVDNHRWRVVLVRENIRALCVEGKPGAARYVAAALEPRQSERPPIRWEIVTENALVERDLATYDCIFLCNVGRLTTQEAEALQRYVHAGGGLSVFLGDQVQASDYNDKLGASAGNQRALPAQLGDLITNDEPRQFDPLEYKHPLVGLFAEHERAGLLTAPTWKYVKLKIPENSKARVALAFDNGDPALIEEQIGRGRVILFASAASSSNDEQNNSPWTEFAVWPSFLPIVQQMVTLLVENVSERRQSLVGEPIFGAIQPSQTNAFTSITTPDGEVERVAAVHREASPPEWRFSDVYQSGIYRVHHGEAVQSPHLFAVNINTAESQLDRYDPALLPSQFERGIQQDTEPVVEVSPYAPASYARWALAALVGLLCLESYLAWHFGTARV